VRHFYWVGCIFYVIQMFFESFSIFQRPYGAFGKQFELAKLNVSRSNNFLSGPLGAIQKKVLTNSEYFFG